MSHKVVLTHNHSHGVCAVCLSISNSNHTASIVSYNDFSSGLRRYLQHFNLGDLHIRSHSFRIGGATYAASLGLSDSQICSLGRWNSDAFKRYIRHQLFQLLINIYRSFHCVILRALAKGPTPCLILYWSVFTLDYL